jgi:hypothetical protein
LRTSFGIKLVLGMPLPQFNLPPFVVAPFRFTWSPTGNGRTPASAFEEGDSGPRHPICKVLEWEQRLRDEEGLTRTQLAKNEGLTKARVTQMLRLLNLPEEARRHLTGLRSPDAIRSFSLRRLFAVAKQPASRRADAFEAMRAISTRSGC